MIRVLGSLTILIAAVWMAPASDVAPPPREKKATINPSAPRMSLTGLAPAKPMFDACVYRYSVGTANPKCQAFVDQALGMYYSYVYMEAARAAETALTHDPECAYAWLMLNRALEKWGRGNSTPQSKGFAGVLGGPGIAALSPKFTKSPADYSLEMARKLMPKASHREQLLIQARLQEKGIWPGTGPDERKKKAAQTLDELLTLYDDDQEAWYWRAQVSEGPNAGIPFYKALLKVNPLHPGANHELVHFYENFKRPALGWPFAEAYIQSSPGIPHAFHMQAHLAMRIGKWGPTTDWSAKAVELELAYQKYQGLTATEDSQFVHHMETLTRSLVHDGRFTEAADIKTKAEGYKFSFKPEWFRMAVTQHDWEGARKVVDQYRRTDKANGAYFAAIVCIEKGDTAQAGREVDTLRQLQQSRKGGKQAEQKLWEAQGRYLCQKGEGEAGLKLLKKLVDATKNDFAHHQWGNGAVYMESWGSGALEAGNATEAEEAFLEALAHDAGSVRGALGLWALCERLDRTEEASRYLKLGQRIWSKAESKDFARLQSDMATRATKIAKPEASAASAEDASSKRRESEKNVP